MNNPLLRQLHPAVQFLFLLILFFTCAAIGSFIALAVGAAMLGIPVLEMTPLLTKADSSQAPALKAMQTIASAFTFLVPSLVFIFLFGRKNVNGLLLRNGGFLMLLGPIYIITASAWIDIASQLNEWLIPAGSLVETMFKSAEESAMAMTKVMLQSNGSLDFALTFLCIAVLPAIFEEVFFRGTMQPLLAKATKNVHLAIWITAALFSAFHMQFYGFLPRLLLGAIMGYLTIWSGSLWTAIGAHFFNNALAVIVFVTYGSLDGPVEEAAEQNMWTTYAMSFLLFGLLTWYLNQRSKWPQLRFEYLGLTKNVEANLASVPPPSEDQTDRLS